MGRDAVFDPGDGAVGEEVGGRRIGHSAGRRGVRSGWNLARCGESVERAEGTLKGVPDGMGGGLCGAARRQWTFAEGRDVPQRVQGGHAANKGCRQFQFILQQARAFGSDGSGTRGWSTKTTGSVARRTTTRPAEPTHPVCNCAAQRTVLAPAPARAQATTTRGLRPVERHGIPCPHTANPG